MVGAASPGRHIVVDLTPLEAGGMNGGAGLVATALVRHMGVLDQQSCFTLLTASDSHDELAALERANVRRVLAVSAHRKPGLASRLADRVLPARPRIRLKQAYREARRQPQARSLIDALKPDVLFCPFTFPQFWQPGVPCVSIVYDLQHLAYPEFFTEEQRLSRQQHVDLAIARSQRVACISEFVRETLLSRTACPPEVAVTIPLGLVHEPSPPAPAVLHRLSLEPGTFLLYPANFWPHKNHRRLFEAVRRSDSRMRLVCTGAPNALMRDLQHELSTDLVQFAGYLGDGELSALLDACQALIFPSLYEGFGLPVLEAMARGKPVLCSDIPSLREVAADCAVYFDPTDPGTIAQAIHGLTDVGALTDRVRRGRERAQAFGTGLDMAARYLDLLRSC